MRYVVCCNRTLDDCCHSVYIGRTRECNSLDSGLLRLFSFGNWTALGFNMTQAARNDWYGMYLLWIKSDPGIVNTLMCGIWWMKTRSLLCDLISRIERQDNDIWTDRQESKCRSNVYVGAVKGQWHDPWGYNYTLGNWHQYQSSRTLPFSHWRTIMMMTTIIIEIEMRGRRVLQRVVRWCIFLRTRTVI